jgi:hypothetical protein
MKIRMMLAALVVLLVTNGSSCFNDEFVVAVNLPINAEFAVNPSSGTSYNGQVTLRLKDLIDPSFLDELQDARFYDIRVYVKGSYGGSVNGSGSINNIPVVTFEGPWAEFQQPQSLLQKSTLLQAQQAGLIELARVLNEFKTNPDVTVILASSGNVSQAPVPPGLMVGVEILSQVDSKVY